MPLDRVRRDPALELTGLDLDAAGEHAFPIRPEISANILDFNTYEASIQPHTFQTDTGDYPWVPVDKTRVEVPQTNLAARVDYQFDMTKSFELLAKLSIYRSTLLDARRDSKKVLDIYERFDPSLGNRLVHGQLGQKAQFLIFPGGEAKSTLNVAPIGISQIYPNGEEVPQDTDFLHIDDVDIRLKDRSSLDVFTPIQQITNFCSSLSPEDEALVGVRTVGGASVMKISQTTESDSSKPLKVKPLATLSFSDKNFANNIKAVDMVGNPYYASECIIVSETGYFGLWDYNSKPREYINNISTIREGGSPDSNVFHKWHSCQYASHPRTIYTAYPHQLDLCDLRAKPGSNTSTIYQLRDAKFALKGVEDNICALAVPPRKHSFEVAIATHDKLMLFDTRYNKRAVLSWQHHVRPFYPSQIQFVTDQVEGCETDQIFAWHPMSTFVHVFEYGKTDKMTKDVPRTLDISFNTNPASQSTLSTTPTNNKHSSSNSSFYVATRPLYGLPTNRFRPSPAAWVTPYATSKTAELRNKSPLAGLTVIPGIAHMKPSQEDQAAGIRTWNVLQLCEDGTVQSKIWCRKPPEKQKLRSLSWFQRPPIIDFDNIEAEHLEAKKQEMEEDSVNSDLSRFFEDLEFRGEIKTTEHITDVKELENKIIQCVRETVAPKTLHEILNTLAAGEFGEIDDNIIGELEKRLSSTEAVHREKVWHNSFEEFGLIDPFALDLGDSISSVRSKLRQVCHLDLESGIEDTTSAGSSSRTKYISEAIQKIATDLTASRHIIGTLTEIPSELQDKPEESAIPANLHFPHLFKSEELLARSQLKLNPAATALAGDWDMESDPNTYSFRRLDGMTAEEALQNEQTTTKKKRRRPSAHFAVQDAAPAVPQVVDTHTKSATANKVTSLSLPSIHDLEFSTQIFPPSPETKKTATAISASQPVAGPFGSRIKHVKKKKKRKEGF
ncbi:hypothetical protein K450DRAFT_262353 [Umbelopsis ramanniana AG]|uniref:Uncharacterized protein n=1 Tax=Umbelopsis ramanniana AG TaxID=1314678 RepID=A0AAD5E2Q3_UMBRA|nr:uncharacterized protein K450DRAFT_262353 [Umbelopsis ramanniana AG]KAI8575315.1 hypothetical protein K450DRAFT_262353 [Umbelopsis ramanniana AG]